MRTHSCSVWVLLAQIAGLAVWRVWCGSVNLRRVVPVCLTGDGLPSFGFLRWDVVSVGQTVFKLFSLFLFCISIIENVVSVIFKVYYVYIQFDKDGKKFG